MCVTHLIGVYCDGVFLDLHVKVGIGVRDGGSGGAVDPPIRADT